MRSSGLTTFVFLALAVTASPTPIDPNSVQARDAWTPAARRDVFLKRAPAPEPAPEPEPEPEIEDLGKRSPFTFSLPKRLPFSGTFGGITINPADNGLGTTAVFADKPSSEGLNARFPFFFKRAGKLEARDIEALEKRKVEMERREAEIVAREAELAAREAEELVRREAEELAKREAEELARREAEELAAREAEELARREAEERAAQEAMMLKKREVLEDIEARQAELEAAKREYDELFAREYEREFQKRDFIESRDLEAREPLSFTVTLNARDFGVDEDLAYLAKRDPQFNLNSFLQQLRGNTTAGGTAAGGGGTNAATNAISRLQNLFGGNTAASTALTNAQNRINSALSRFGFNFRRDELEQLTARGPTPFSFKEDTVSKREPFDFDAFVKAKRSDISL